ncbi:hypothetical protein MLD38_029917 [Melastoma candidum]|uniref:Uncharacterized protein n=1 Tax=Melastoma candidum TaxID=119954 RepID=A0ACB9MQA6_9MYRT|nr:hypothetical protein MLD38_029917 [Melastoma candidum]
MVTTRYRIPRSATSVHFVNTILQGPFLLLVRPLASDLDHRECEMIMFSFPRDDSSPGSQSPKVSLIGDSASRASTYRARGRPSFYMPFAEPLVLYKRG